MRAVTLLIILASAPLALTGPAKIPPDQRIVEREEPGAVPEEWIIPDMKLHFMTQFTGVPGENSWPEEKGFDSEISFQMVMPSGSVTCNTTWKPDREHLQTGTLPADNITFPCSFTDDEDRQGENVTFCLSRWFGLGERRAELSFLVRVWHTVPGEDGDDYTMFYAEAPITANQDNTEPTSYLTCMYFQPWAGMKCEMHGMMSNHEDVHLNATMLDLTDHSKTQKRDSGSKEHFGAPKRFRAAEVVEKRPDSVGADEESDRDTAETTKGKQGLGRRRAQSGQCDRGRFWFC